MTTKTATINRRVFLKASLAAGLTGGAAAIGLLTPRLVLAAWNQEAFGSNTVADALNSGLGAPTASPSDSISIDAPDIAADGASVPIGIVAQLNDVRSIALLSENNAKPLCCIFRPGPGVRPTLRLRIKMGKSGDVIAVAKSGDKLYTARRKIQVTAGGCT